MSCELPNKRKKFEPAALGLNEEFVLTDYARLKGCSCKIPQPKLLELLKRISSEPGRKGNVGMDCSIVPLKAAPDMFMVSTTDFFFPSVEDPYLQGQIGAANVLSDMYAMGIDHCDTLLMLLAASTDMDEDERYIVTEQIMKGFAERAELAGCEVTGGQSVLNPWPLIGGIAASVAKEENMVRPVNIKPGDILVLTKPIGHQLAVNAKQWLKRPSPLYKEIEGKVTVDEIEELYGDACENMRRLNVHGARLMRKYKATAATDITGFGLLGHVINLSEAQKLPVTLEIHTVPMLKTAAKISELIDDKYRFFKGLSAETSGGLLVALPDEAAAKNFITEITGKGCDEGTEAWIVGKALPREASSTDYAHLTENYKKILV